MTYEMFIPCIEDKYWTQQDFYQTFVHGSIIFGNLILSNMMNISLSLKRSLTGTIGFLIICFEAHEFSVLPSHPQFPYSLFLSPSHTFPFSSPFSLIFSSKFFPFYTSFILITTTKFPFTIHSYYHKCRILLIQFKVVLESKEVYCQSVGPMSLSQFIVVLKI